VSRHRVRVRGHGVIEAEHGANLGRLLASQGILPLPCGGRGFCGQCVVRVVGKASPPTGNELARGLGAGGLRLACQTRVLGDLEVELVGRPAARVPLLSMHLEIGAPRPVFKLIEASPQPPVYKGGSPLEDSLRLDEKPVFFAECCGSVRGRVDSDKPLVVLVDLGTTKLAYHVLDEEGCLVQENAVPCPLLAYGSDIISRLTAALEDPAARRRMKDSLRKAVLDAMPGGSTALVAVAGNSVMESLFLGLPLEQLGEKPFQPFAAGPFTGGLGDAALWVAPMIGGFVGGDAVADLAAALALKPRPPFMIVDLGTNTEILVYTGRSEDPLYAASTPAGPAFEGHIAHGASIHAAGVSRARVRGVGGSGEPLFEVEVSGEGPPLGLLGSGVISLVAELARHGFLDEGGRMIRGYTRVRGVKAVRVTRGALGDIMFTQRDVREFQKAMASVKAAWRIVLLDSGIDAGELNMVYVAGNLGSSVDAGDLLYLGLIPPIRESRVASMGNMVLPGLKYMVFDEEAMAGVTSLARRAVVVELAERSMFMEEWIKGLRLPRGSP
jgi:uncharacterized 2Fe-2S/4Fe-4S cluster protein (DUF4445 family)